MTEEKISLTEALVVIKMLDKRLTKAITGSNFVSLQVGQKTEVIDAKSSMASVVGLRKRRDAIQKAKLIANSVTKITVANKEMTIMEAIEKKSSIHFDVMLLGELRTQLGTINDNITYMNERVQERLDKQLEEVYGKGGKVREEDYKAISEPFLKNNAAILVDPIGIQKQIDDLDIYIDTFLSEVDIRLSEINARTIITVQY